MRWLVFFIFAYLALGAQVGVGEWPNIVLLGVIFICLNTGRETALTAALLLGLLQDFLTLHPLGLYAFSYGMVGLVCTTTNRVVYSNHPLTHVFFGFVGSIVTAAVIIVHSYVRPGGTGHEPAWPLFWGSVYTAAVAPIVLGLLTKARPVFGFQPLRRSVRSYQ